MRLVFLGLCLCALSAFAGREVVQISDDGQTTVPTHSIATPAQVSTASDAAGAAYAIATNLSRRASVCVEKLATYSTNYVVTSTVYVQSIGGVPYDPSNQTIRVQSMVVGATEIKIVGTVKQLPLTPPKLDWRTALASGAWSNVTATVETCDIPAGVTNAAAAYLFTLAKPAGEASAFFRIVDNSTGASGSGLWWVVFGGISVDGHLGYNGIVTNGVAELRFVGGILTEPEPLGGL